jgi:hypothetical protein
MCYKKIVVGVGVGVGTGDIVDGDQRVDFFSFLSLYLCGGSWGLTLGNPCMQSP